MSQTHGGGRGWVRCSQIFPSPLPSSGKTGPSTHQFSAPALWPGFGDPGGFCLMVPHSQAGSCSLSSHSVGFCRLCSPQDYSSISVVVCFLSLLGRLQANHFLKSPSDRINLTLNHQLPTGPFQILKPSTSLPELPPPQHLPLRAVFM